MASYNELNALIDAYINRNGVQAITGQILNGVLKAMVEQLGRGYTIMGAAIPATDPGTPDGPECYFASETGTYTDFDGLQVVPGELALLCYTPADGWMKETIYEGFQEVQATIDGNVGTPSVGVSYADGVLSFDFHNMKGNPGQNGQDGAAAGFGTIGADITGGVGTPGVSVESSGPATAKNLQFHFTNLKGETGVTSVVATVDNTTGTPACTVSLVGQQLTLAFSGLKGAQGDTGSSVDYPFTIVNNLTTDDATQALSAAQGVVLDGKVSQLEAKVDGGVFSTTPNWTGSKRIIEDGSVVNSGSAFSVSDFIEVQEGPQTIVYGVNGYASVSAPSVHFYDSTQAHIGYLYATGTTDITTNIATLHAKYIRFSQYDDGSHPTSGVSVTTSVEGCAKESDLDDIRADLANAVMFTAQTLTDSQKEQARQNIGAAADGGMSGYVTEDEFTQLENEVNGVNYNPTLTWTGSKRIVEDGSIVASGSAFSISDFVEVEEGVPTTVYGVNGFAGVTAPSVHFYNESQVHIGYLYATGTTVITTNIATLHAKYIRFSQYDDGNYPYTGVSLRSYVEGCVKEHELDDIKTDITELNTGYRNITQDDFTESMNGKFTVENGDIYGLRASTDPQVAMIFKEGIKAIEFTIASLWDSSYINLAFGVGEDAGDDDKECYALCFLPTSAKHTDADIGFVQNQNYDGNASNTQASSIWGAGHFSGDYRQPQVKPDYVSVGDRCRIELIDGHFFRGTKYNSASGRWEWWFCLDTDGSWNNPNRYGWSTRKAIGFAIRFAVITAPAKKLLSDVRVINEDGKLSSVDFTLSQNFPPKKNWVAIGDSITEINENNGLSYVGYAQRKLGYKVDNQGKGGWTIYKLWRDRVTAGWEDAVSALNDGDIVTLLAGTNDFDTASFSTPADDAAMDAAGNPHPRFGTTDPTDPDAKDTHTTLGCLRLMIERILTLKPGARLYVFSPFYREKGAPVGSTSWTTLFINSDGRTIYDYADAIYEVAREYNLPAYNTCRDCGINAMTLATYTYDDLHIGQVGGELIGDYVAKRIS